MNDLVAVALVGTARHEGAGQIDPQHPAEALLAGISGKDREEMFLLRAGVRAVWEQCGLAPAEVAAVAPALPEDRPVAPEAFVPILQEAARLPAPGVLVEFLGALAKAGLLLPHTLLPSLLGAASREVRKSLLPVVGQRGRWLAQFNPQWQWVLSAAGVLPSEGRQRLEQVWLEGTLPDRCQALATLRQWVTAEGRRWLEETLPREKPEHRARLIGALAAGLEPADEPLLEKCLDDRSEQVRQAAAALLARLPGSALAGRMRHRAENLLNPSPKGGRRRLRLECRPPQTMAADGLRDGIPRTPPRGQGKQAAWTEAILAAVPPAFWCQKLSASPAELIQAIEEDDFADAVLAGWTRAAAALAPRDPESAPWLGALWDYWLNAAIRPKKLRSSLTINEFLEMLLRAMPCALAEEAMLGLVRQHLLDDSVPLHRLLESLPTPWSERFASEYLAAMTGAMAPTLKRRHEAARALQWIRSMAVAATAIPAAALAHAEELARMAASSPAAEPESPFFAKHLDDFAAIIRLRLRFYTELQGTGAAEASRSHSPS